MSAHTSINGGGTSPEEAGFLVLVHDSVTLRNTVGHAVSRAIREHEDGTTSRLHFVFPVARRLAVNEEDEDANELLRRVAAWAHEDLGEHADDVAVVTDVVGRYQYLFNPGQYADVAAEYATRHGLSVLVLDPEFNPTGITPLLPPLETELKRAGLRVEVAPVEREARRNPIARRAGIGQFVLLFGLTYGFYLLVGGTLSQFDLATGAISAAIVSAVLWRVSLRGPVNPVRFCLRVGRMVLYVPFLLWEIVKANVHIAYVVLHPSLPIDPKMVEFDALVWSELPVTTLANSITLTPGTLTVEVTSRHFTVHTLTKTAREDLFAGSLERAVRFVFYGRAAARIPSPEERGERAEGDA